MVEWPGEVPGFTRGRKTDRYRRVGLELDVEHERYRPEPVALLAPLTSLLHEREVEDAEDLLTMTAQVFRAVAAVGFRQVDHWEARPGGWLPLPEAAHTRLAEPVAHLVRALSDPAWASVGQARRFAARLSGPDRVRLDIVVRRVHRERVHAVSLDLGGRITRGSVEDLVARIHQQLPLLRATVAAVESPIAASPPVRRR
ncbi:MAG: hypothetical protein L3J92_01920 [Thermoplasmata archaeon]|nr:hypothetical protein [Thermoplasmata archaeon]